MAENETLDWETLEQRLKELRAKYGKESSPLLLNGAEPETCCSVIITA